MVAISDAESARRYEWDQEGHFVSVWVPLAEDITAKDIRCTIKPREISITVKGDEIVSGDLTQIVKPDDSLWMIEDDDRHRGRCLHVSLKKSLECTEWMYLLKADMDVNWDKFCTTLRPMDHTHQCPTADPSTHHHFAPQWPKTTTCDGHHHH
ncbi:unnamed protein product [Vitrella brassicaformis CCMP3155]|uniref:CS domain-containing protein n=1 Tax=Vitrella brassicaformis (strain CCMP3155) TaxID=1169540 RepID=A0A0G4GUE2_VITBC|nr:unnamed protein product [Vitrella brassicaformis CCMP3155]|eukprot:CEM34459.1 unnamed protein product [Vitrella brassicaformis CCMP3155]